MAETNTALESNYNPIKINLRVGVISNLYFYKISQFAAGRMNSGNASVKVLTGKRLLYLFS